MPGAAWYGARPLPVAYTLAGQSLTGGPDELGRYWSVKSIRGWRGTAKPRNRITDRVNASGSMYGAQYRDARVITLADVRVSCPDAGTRVATEDALPALFPDRDDVDLYPLVRTGEDGVAQVRYVTLDDSIDPVPVGPRWLDFDLQLIAPDPRKYAAGWVTTEAGPPIDGTGGIVSNAAGIVSTSGGGIGAGIGGTPSVAIAQGGGAVDNPMVIEILGQGDDVIVADLNGSSRIRYRGQVPSGVSVFLNCDSQPAYQVPGAAGPIPGYGALLGTSDASSAVFVIGGWPVVPAGQGRGFAVVSGQMASDARLRVHHRPAWD